MIIKEEFPGVYTVIAGPSEKSKEERQKWLDDFIEKVKKERAKFENCNRATTKSTE